MYPQISEIIRIDRIKRMAILQNFGSNPFSKNNFSFPDVCWGLGIMLQTK
jgi:hypothetical protein